MNKASGGDGIPVELFQILKDDAAKVLHSICQQIWKTQQWPQDWKRSVFIPIPKKGISHFGLILSTPSFVSLLFFLAGTLRSLPVQVRLLLVLAAAIIACKEKGLCRYN